VLCLQYINYDFYDVREIYKKFSNGDRSVGVSGILEEMGLSGLANSHDAMADAYNTMIILKGILDRTGKSLTELLEENQNARDKTENGVVESIALAEKFLKEHLTGDGSNLFYTELNNKRYKQFLRELKAHCKGNSRLQKAKISISKNYLYDHYRQALNLTQLIFESGGVVKRDESILPDIYVMYETPKELIGETDAEFDFIQEGVKNGGIGETFGSYILENGLAPRFKLVAFPDCFVKQGKVDEILHEYQLDCEGMCNVILKDFGKVNENE
jgi:hypothetical protein